MDGAKTEVEVVTRESCFEELVEELAEGSGCARRRKRLEVVTRR